jgi:CheY-like chemotaxis protein
VTSHPHHVLVVEDDLEIRETLVEILQENGCEAIGVSDGQQALAYLKSASKHPCLIFLDLMMPVMDGRAFREAQLEDPVLKTIPVVVLSAYHDIESMAQSLEAKAIIKKPPKIDQLVKSISAYC